MKGCTNMDTGKGRRIDRLRRIVSTGLVGCTLGITLAAVLAALGWPSGPSVRVVTGLCGAAALFLAVAMGDDEGNEGKDVSLRMKGGNSITFRKYDNETDGPWEGYEGKDE